MSDLPIVAISQGWHEQGDNPEGITALRGHIARLLVREAVQNAWDARDDNRGNQSVHFRIDGYDFLGENLSGLKSLLPVENLSRKGFQGDLTHPSEVLERESIRLLVVSDRNTVGLCGPDRAGRAWKPIRHGRRLARGQSRYANFVLNRGRSSEITGLGDGGAYGLGKMSLWMASECGTVLIHTKTTDEDGESIERFIGVIRGYDFNVGAQAYTGRHFVGRQPDRRSDFIAPLTGRLAERARKLLPVPSYTDDDGNPTDGTTVVIVAPRLTLAWDLEINRLRDAVRWQVWPKRVPGTRPRTDVPDMKIQVSCNGEEVAIPEPLADPEIRPYALTLLECIRGNKSRDDGRDFTASCLRPEKVLGVTKFRKGGNNDDNVFHWTLTRDAFATPLSPTGIEGTGHPESEIDDEPAVDFERPWGQIALIRRRPLLLVRYEAINSGTVGENDVGVFLSADDDEVEKALTLAEPPAHDDWKPDWARSAVVSSRRLVTFVTITLREIRRARAAFARVHNEADKDLIGEGERNVSDRISGGNFGRGPGTFNFPAERSLSRNPPRSLRPQSLHASLDLLRTETGPDGRAEHHLSVLVNGLPRGAKTVRLTVQGEGRDSTGSIPVDDLVNYRWMLLSGRNVEGPVIEIGVEDTEGLTLIVLISRTLRFRPRVELRAI